MHCSIVNNPILTIPIHIPTQSQSPHNIPTQPYPFATPLTQPPNPTQSLLPQAASFYDFDELITTAHSELAGGERAVDTAVRQLSLLRFMARDRRSDIFWEAVPEGTPGYFEVISTPMDFGHITTATSEGKYVGGGVHASGGWAISSRTGGRYTIVLFFS